MLKQRRAWVFGSGYDYKTEGWEWAWGGEYPAGHFVWTRHLYLLPVARLLYDSEGSYPFPYDGTLGLLPRMRRISRRRYLVAFTLAAAAAVLKVIAAALVLLAQTSKRR